MSAPRAMAEHDGIAIEIGGRVFSYGELRGLVDDRATSVSHEPRAVVASDDTIEVLIDLLAAPASTELLVMSSGSTGAPHAILRTRASWYDSFAAFGALCGTRAGDRVALTAPLSVSAQLFAALQALSVGATVCDEPARADIVHLTPTRLSRLLAGERMPRTVVVAGAQLPTELADRATHRGVRVVQYYGAAELSIVAAATHPEPLRAFPGVEIELRSGELWARSDFLSNPRTGGAMRIDERGFATVGDLAELDADGSLSVRGRGNAAITVAGVTVVCEELERVLNDLPGVRAAAVFGAPHTLLGSEIVAVVEPADLDLAQLKLAARAALTAPQTPRRWFAVDALPRTTSGKLARSLLATAYGDAAAHAGSTS